jgi:hypothetical protein
LQEYLYKNGIERNNKTSDPDVGVCYSRLKVVRVGASAPKETGPSKSRPGATAWHA